MPQKYNSLFRIHAVKLLLISLRIQKEVCLHPGSYDFIIPTNILYNGRKYIGFSFFLLQPPLGTWSNSPYSNDGIELCSTWVGTRRISALSSLEFSRKAGGLKWTFVPCQSAGLLSPAGQRGFSSGLFMLAFEPLRLVSCNRFIRQKLFSVFSRLNFSDNQEN